MSGGKNRWTWIKSTDGDLNDWYTLACFMHWLSFASAYESNPNCCFLCFEICFTKTYGMFIVVFLAPVQSKLMSSFFGKVKLKYVLYLNFTVLKYIYIFFYILSAWERGREQMNATIKHIFVYSLCFYTLSLEEEKRAEGNHNKTIC